jgi:hypothetical protein
MARGDMARNRRENGHQLHLVSIQESKITKRPRVSHYQPFYMKGEIDLFSYLYFYSPVLGTPFGCIVISNRILLT